MKKQRKTKQRLLQVSFGLCLLFFVLMIGLVAVPPSGIYSYFHQGYKEFHIGSSKERVLKKINKRKAIRAIRTCDPDDIFTLTSRKRFELIGALVLSDVWICPGRTGKDFLFLFKNGRLERLLIQRLRFGKKDEGSILFSRCTPEILRDIDTYLTTREKLAIFYDTGSEKKK